MKIRLVLFTLLFYGFCFGQENVTNISLYKKMLSHVESKKSEADSLLKYAKLYLNTYKETDSLFSKVNLLAGKAYLYSQNDSCLLYLRAAVKSALKKQDNNTLCKAYKEMGTYHIMKKGSIDSFVHYLYKSKALLSKINNSELKASIYLELGKANKYKGQFDSAVYYAKKVLTILPNQKPSATKAMCFSLISSYYNLKEDLEKAKIYSRKEFKECEKLKLEAGMGASLMTYGSFFLERDGKEIDSAYYYFKKSEKYFKKIGDIYSLNFLKNNHYLTYYRLKKQYNKAYSLINFKQVKSSGQKARVAEIIYFSKSKEKGLQLLEEAFKDSKNLYDSAYVFQQRYNIFKLDNQYKKALEAYEILLKLEERIKTKDFDTSLADLEIKYQTQQKENKILKLANKNEKQKVTITQNRLLIAIILGVVSVLALIIYFRGRKRKQQQQLQLLEKTIEASDNEKNRIGRELHDGIASKIIQLTHNDDSLNTEYAQQLHSIYNEIRNLSHQLNNAPAHSNEPIFERILELTSPVKTQDVNLKIQPISLIVPEPMATHIYRIVQELLANNSKYANSTIIDITIKAIENQFVFSYSDNGVGIADFKKGGGLKNIEHRVNLLKGTINYNSKESGFSVDIKIPI